MKTELTNFDIFPKVFATDKPVTITVKPLGRHVAFSLGTEYSVIVRPISEGSPRAYAHRQNIFEYKKSPCDDGCIRFEHTFCGEQEFFIRIEADGRRIVHMSVYALSSDLAGRYPYRGDLHMHTFRSDGNESPEIVCANYRKYGYDFFAITDHHRYYPSLEAIDAYKDVALDFNIVQGEEIHLPDNDVHIVSFGSEYSVNGLLESSAQTKESDRRVYPANAKAPDVMSADEYRNQVRELLATLDIPAELADDGFTYASCVWAFNHIKNGGGLGIFCHPYWISDVYQVPESLTDFILKNHPFDAFEVLGGENYYEQNGHQAEKYNQDRISGVHYPIVGSTDSHRSVNNINALIASTIVFSPANERGALIESIKDFYSVAVDTISKEFRLVGDFRLTKYACFLMNEYFPIHDELCVEEGIQMKAYVTGAAGSDADAAENLNRLAPRMTALREKYFQF
jgi:Predicted metal-dependent phosphoesterases (PHP family)